MTRIIGIDYGTKRCGIAETDDLQIIASALDVVPTSQIFDYLASYLAKYKTSEMVVGQPFRASGELSDVESDILKFIKTIEKKHPDLKVSRLNEAFTSKMALDTMIQAGAKKKARRVKGNLDKISATLILQQFLEIKRNQNSL